jgi:hypothetical protein
MPVGTEVNRHLMPTTEEATMSMRRVPKKNAEDHEIERRVRAHIRREMVERGIGVNGAGRRLNVAPGSLSRILNETRGFGPGFILRVQRAFQIPSKMLIEEDPADPKLLEPGVPEPVAHKPRRRPDRS